MVTLSIFPLCVLLFILSMICFFIADSEWKNEIKARKWGKLGSLAFVALIVFTIVGISYN